MSNIDFVLLLTQLKASYEMIFGIQGFWHPGTRQPGTPNGNFKAAKKNLHAKYNIRKILHKGKH